MKYTIYFHPYADQYAEIEIPHNITGTPAIKEYIENHWHEIQFEEPDLDYSGTDFEIYDEDDNNIEDEDKYKPDIVQESGDYRVELFYAGEGYHGDYEENNPDDKPLYRADVFVKENGEWNLAASCCTMCSVKDEENYKIEFANQILSAAINGKHNHRDIERALSVIACG